MKTNKIFASFMKTNKIIAMLMNCSPQQRCCCHSYVGTVAHNTFSFFCDIERQNSSFAMSLLVIRGTIDAYISYH
jgi:hypothetical protein